MILGNKRDREAWIRERTIESLKANTFLEENDLVLVAETNCFYKVVTEITDIPLQNNLYAKAQSSEVIGNSSTADKLKIPRNINLIGNAIGTTSFDGSKDVNIDVKVKKLETSKNIKLIGDVDGNVNFDGSKNVEISTIVNKLNIARNIALSGDITGNADFDGSKNITINTTVQDDSHTHSDSTIISLDASKITTGIIDIARLPAAALERLVEVNNDTERFVLTKEQVQLGDVVKVKDTLKMYKVINDNKLNTEEGYSVFVAGRAAEVPWSGVTGKPTSLPNQYGIIVKFNNNPQFTYNGSEPKELNITPENIGTYTRTQIENLVNTKANADTVNSKLDLKADKTHSHPTLTIRNGVNSVVYDGTETKSIDIQAGSGTPGAHRHNAADIIEDRYRKFCSEDEKNSWNSKADGIHSHSGFIVKFNNNPQFAYNGSESKELNITPQSIGAQPAGDYALSQHEHLAFEVGTYSRTEIDQKLSSKVSSSDVQAAIMNKADKVHSHTAEDIESLKGYFKKDSSGAITSTDSLNDALSKIENQLETKVSSSDVQAAILGHNHNTLYLPLTGGRINGSLEILSNLSVSGEIAASKVFNAVWNDYAELFERGEETEAGDIICLDTSSTKEQYIKADSASKRVIGVHSDTYGHLIGGEELNNYEDNFKKFIPIGLAGRVNVKVKGKVDIGDYIVPSDEKGIGRSYNKDIDDRDMIIGYLVEADECEDVRRLKMFINKK